MVVFIVEFGYKELMFVVFNIDEDGGFSFWDVKGLFIGDDFGELNEEEV